MAAIPTLLKFLNGASEDGFSQFRQRTYLIPDGSTLSDTGIDLQKGDTLPVRGDADGASWEIVSSKELFLQPRTGKNAHRGGKAVQVTALSEVVAVAKSGSGAWSELSGTRKVLDSDPQTLRYQIEFTADISDSPTRPSNGDSYATINGGSSGFTTTGLDREPVAVQVSQVNQVTVLKRHVTVDFQAQHARSTLTTSTFTEINPRQRIRVGKNSYRGRRRFSVAIGSETAAENSLYGSAYPNMSGKYAAKCNRVETKEYAWPNRSLVIADYETPRIVGEGVLRIQIGGTAEKAVIDLDNSIISGTDSAANARGPTKQRRIIQGSDIIRRPEAVIILETAATEFNVNTFLARVGHVNKYALPNFGGAQPGTLLFTGSPQTTFRMVGNLWYVNLAFKYSGNPARFPKWNSKLRSQAGNWVARRIPATSTSGLKITGADKFYIEWVPKPYDEGVVATGEEDIATHRMYPEADFRDLGKSLVIRSL